MSEIASAPETATWSRWHRSAPYTLGLEEEVMLLDAERDWALAARIDEVLPALSGELQAHVGAETQDAVLELATDPHDDVAAATEQARTLRARLKHELAEMGVRAACAGTHPAAMWTEIRIAGGARHQLVYGAMRELARREPTFGLHVHVGVPDAEAAITLLNRMRVHLPLLLALSANSPYWQQRDSGLASVRTPIFQAFPRVGIPRAFHDYDDYVETVDRLQRCGAIPESTHLWWDVRPQPRFGTVEVRIMDVQTDSAATRALVALVQCIARLELEDGYHGHPLADSIEVLMENRFVASRDGVEAELIDAVSEERVPVPVAVERLLKAVAPHAAVLGCSDALDDVAALARHNGAQRQRAVFAESGRLSAVMQDLSDRF